MQTLNLKSHRGWVEYCKSVKKPPDIPYNPEREYKDKGWISWGDWLGTANVAPKNRKYLPFKQAREIVRSLNMKNQGEFRAYSKSITRRLDIPSAPQRVYKKEWKGINDWLGTDISPYTNREFWSFEKAREFVRKLDLQTMEEWRRYCGTGKKPNFIPSNPEKKYKNEGWLNYGDWLGTDRIANQNKEFWPFEQAREFARSLRLKSVGEWEEYCKSGEKPAYIPYSPAREYKDKGWISWGDWLGTYAIAPQNKRYRSFVEARKFSRSLRLNSQTEWFVFARSRNLPPDIPIAPHLVYQNKGWTTWGDWIGTDREATQNVGWTIQKVKELIKN